MLCDVIQYMRPDGRRVPQQVEIDDALLAHYERMRKSGYRFAAEVLTNGQVSATIENHDEDLDMRVVMNGPGVQTAYESMLRKNFSREGRNA